MFKYTESNTVFDELYGTDKTISPQVAKTFNLSKEQQQPQSLVLKEYMLQNQYLQQKMIKSSPVSDRIMVEDLNITGNDNNSNILGTLKEQQLLQLSRELNKPQVLILFIEDLKSENEKMQRQICRLKQMITNYQKMVQQNNKEHHDQLISEKQIRNSSYNKQILKMIQKLKYYEQKTSTLESSNKELFQKISSMRPKLQLQYREMYKSQIQRLQSEVILVKYKHQEQINDLKEKLQQKELNLQSLKKLLKQSTKHICNICRQYQLLQSLNKLQKQLEKVKTQNQSLQRCLDIKNQYFSSIKQQVQTISDFKK